MNIASKLLLSCTILYLSWSTTHAANMNPMKFLIPMKPPVIAPQEIIKTPQSEPGGL